MRQPNPHPQLLTIVIFTQHPVAVIVLARWRVAGIEGQNHCVDDVDDAVILIWETRYGQFFGYMLGGKSTWSIT